MIIQDKACLTVGESQVLQECAEAMDLVALAELTPDQILDQGAIPTARLMATRIGTFHNQFLQSVPLGGSKLGGTTRRTASHRAAPNA